MKENMDFKVAQGIKANVYTGGASPTVTKGAAIDRQGFGSALVALNYDAPDDTAQLDFKVQESDTTTDTDFTDVTGATIATMTASSTPAGVKQGFLNLEARKRYIRIVTTVTTNTKKWPHGVDVILFGAKVKPAVASQAFNVL